MTLDDRNAIDIKIGAQKEHYFQVAANKAIKGKTFLSAESKSINFKYFEVNAQHESLQ